MTKNGSYTLCGQPVRDETLAPILTAAVGFSLAVLFYVLRILSTVPKNGRTMGWDDWALTATVLLTIPPTIFAFLRESPSARHLLYTAYGFFHRRALHI